MASKCTLYVGLCEDVNQYFRPSGFTVARSRLKFAASLRFVRNSEGSSLLLPDQFLFRVEHKRDAWAQRVGVNELVATVQHRIEFGYLFSGA